MKIKAIYKDNAVGLETEVVIISCFGGGNVLCLNEEGDLFMIKISDLKVTDKKYLNLFEE